MKLNNETKIGILVVVTLAILGALTWQAGDYKIMVGGYELKARFHDVEGVGMNSPVTLNGLEVGRVRSLNILYGEQAKIELSLWIKANVQIAKGVKARIKNMGFMGEKYIGLTTPEGVGEYLPPGSVIIGLEPTNFEDLMADGGEVAKNLKEISSQINERLKVNSQAIDEVIGNMNITMKNVAAISTNVNERLNLNKELVDEMVKNLDSASKNLEELTYDLKENPWKLLYKQKQARPVKKEKKTN